MQQAEHLLSDRQPCRELRMWVQLSSTLCWGGKWKSSSAAVTSWGLVRPMAACRLSLLARSVNNMCSSEEAPLQQPCGTQQCPNDRHSPLWVL